MTTEQFRGVLAAILVVAVGFAIYLGWHFTHEPGKPAACDRLPENASWVAADCK